ncbi:hypothetical protein Y032_0278g1149 [Ancylostoma ceylanicum]|uniref:Uncharacterized protein n=1 Tax=Ancylostoma ceylanicum TaxID=53326 RepID=A0A016S878_9BILA|nr:hypothetical protein Y032_0278g1149 [Ancylostoma ceylanicum]
MVEAAFLFPKQHSKFRGSKIRHRFCNNLIDPLLMGYAILLLSSERGDSEARLGEILQEVFATPDLL